MPLRVSLCPCAPSRLPSHGARSSRHAPSPAFFPSPSLPVPTERIGVNRRQHRTQNSACGIRCRVYLGRTLTARTCVHPARQTPADSVRWRLAFPSPQCRATAEASNFEVAGEPLRWGGLR
eukprot:3933136-Rhodomonas_salina.1